jgi:hypothetical protein
LSSAAQGRGRGQSCSFPCSSRHGWGAAADAPPPPRSSSSLLLSGAGVPLLLRLPLQVVAAWAGGRWGRSQQAAWWGRNRDQGASRSLRIWRTRGANGKMQGVSRPPLQAGFLQKPTGKGWRRFCRTPVRVVSRGKKAGRKEDGGGTRTEARASTGRETSSNTFQFHDFKRSEEATASTGLTFEWIPSS